MKLFYIDDSYDDVEFATFLGGFIIDENDYPNLCIAFGDVKKKYGLHSYDPVKFSPDKENRAQRKLEPAQRDKFKRDILDVLQSAPLKIVVAMIHGQFNNSQNRIMYTKKALEFLAQRLQIEVYSTSEKGRLILDFPSSDMGKHILKHYSELHYFGSIYPTFEMKFKNLAETFYYTEGTSCNGLQLADFVVGTCSHAHKKKKYHFLDIIKPKIRKTNRIKGVGLIYYPQRSTIFEPLIDYCEA